MTGDFTITNDRAALDVALIYRYLSEESYWARGVDYETVERSLDNSLCFGGFVTKSDGIPEQVAFARIVTDYATLAYLSDVFVLSAWQGKGYGKIVMQAVMTHPRLQNLRRFYLATRDAHELYAQYGFEPLKRPHSVMEINRTVILPASEVPRRAG